MRQRLKQAKLVVVIFLISGCACQPELIPVSTKLPVLSVPELPKLTREQEDAIADDTYEILVERDMLLQSHIKTLNGLIETHNRQNEPTD